MITLSFVVNVSSTTEQGTMDLKINEYCRLIKLEGYSYDVVLMAVQRLKGRVKFFPSWLDLKEEIDVCRYLKTSMEGKTESGVRFLEKLYPMLPAEVDRWQAEVDFRAVQIKIHDDEVEICLEKAPAQTIVEKYASYFNRIFPAKQIMVVSFKGVRVKV